MLSRRGRNFGGVFGGGRQPALHFDRARVSARASRTAMRPTSSGQTFTRADAILDAHAACARDRYPRRSAPKPPAIVPCTFSILQRDLAHALGQARHGETQARLGVHDPRDERQQYQDQRPDDEGGDLEPALHHSFGEKLRCRRGPGRSVLPAGVVSACATSMPTETTGRRKRTPMPTEYMSGSPKLSNALPASREHRHREVPRQVAHELDGAREQMFAADLFVDGVAVFVDTGVRRSASRGLLDRREVVDAEAAHAAIAAGEESLRRRETAGARHRGRADVAAQQHVPLASRSRTRAPPARGSAGSPNPNRARCASRAAPRRACG